MKQGTIVEHTESGRRGVVVNDAFGVCSPEEIGVVYYGTTYSDGTQQELLRQVGTYEAVPDLKACGAGKGDDCCIFLTVGPEGPCCERFSSLRNSLIFKTMRAKREPPEPYPDCMDQARAELDKETTIRSNNERGMTDADTKD